MGWITFAILTAISEAAKDVLSKFSLKTNNVYIVAWAYRLFAIPFLLLTLFWIEIPALTNTFWYALIVSGILNVITSILYMKALEHSEISLVVPLVTFTPIFLLITSPIIIGEFPNVLGIIGVVLIVIGSYWLNTQSIKRGDIWAPLKSIAKQTGSRYMLAVAFIWSISSNFDKVGIKGSSPMFWALCVNSFIALLMFPIVLIKVKGFIIQTTKHYKQLVPIGLASALVLIFQMLAVELTLVSYVISIKRISAALTVVAGYYFFKEGNIARKLIGVGIMLTGVLLISFN